MIWVCWRFCTPKNTNGFEEWPIIGQDVNCSVQLFCANCSVQINIDETPELFGIKYSQRYEAISSTLILKVDESKRLVFNNTAVHVVRWVHQRLTRNIHVFLWKIKCPQVVTTRRIAERGLNRRQNVCPSVRLYVTVWYRVKTEKHRPTIKMLRLHYSSVLLASGDTKTLPKFQRDRSKRRRQMRMSELIIIIIMTKTVFTVLSSWQSHCESSPGSFDECKTAPSGRRSKTKSDDLDCESACTGCQKLHPPSPFIIITQPEIWYSFYRPTEGRRVSRPSWLVTYRRLPILVLTGADIAQLGWSRPTRYH